jgi:hypothetical protein
MPKGGFMFLAATNKAKGLLLLSFIGDVRVEELRGRHEEVIQLVADLPPGFRLLTDLSDLRSMELGCEAELSQVMEVLDRKGISTIVRVIPEPEKDIGFNILGAFHYRRQVQTVTCQTMEEAAGALSL